METENFNAFDIRGRGLHLNQIRFSSGLGWVASVSLKQSKLVGNTLRYLNLTVLCKYKTIFLCVSKYVYFHKSTNAMLRVLPSHVFSKAIWEKQLQLQISEQLFIVSLYLTCSHLMLSARQSMECNGLLIIILIIRDAYTVVTATMSA